MDDIKDETRVLLEESIEKEFVELENLEGKDKDAAVQRIKTLYSLKTDEDRVNFDYDSKLKDRQMADAHFDKECEIKDTQINMEADCKNVEFDIKHRQLKEQKIDRFVNAGVAVVTTLFGIIAYDVWMKRGLRFEEHGTITTPETKNLMSKMLPTFKK